MSDRSSSSRFRLSIQSPRRVPPVRARFEKSTSAHMLPTSNQSPSKSVFSSKHRLVKRNLPFFQSKNKLQVQNQHTHWRLFSLLQHDWFHVGLRFNLWLSVLLLLGGWTAVILIFAGIYMAIDRDNIDTDCGLGPAGEAIGFSPAFAFSLETCTTVGYGLPSGTNAFFEAECKGVQIAIYFQMVWSMMFNAFLFAFFFARIAKSEARGVQVIFSKKAIISHRPDVPYPCFYFRVFDIDATYPVVEAHVRMYVVTQKSPIPIPLRIVIPNDDYGSMLFLSLPCQVVHAMDAYSPLVPPTQVKARTSATVPRDGLHLRQVDGSTNSRDDVCCPVCGECYGTVERLIKHGKYQHMVETHDEYDVKGSHQEIDWDELEELLTKSTTWTLAQLEAFFRSNVSEVLCVIEGIDPLASGTFQAVQSYQYEDIHFGDAHFADCVCLNRKRGLAVDLDFFHKIRPNDTQDSREFEQKEKLPAEIMLVPREQPKESTEVANHPTAPEHSARSVDVPVPVHLAKPVLPSRNVTAPKPVESIPLQSTRSVRFMDQIGRRESDRPRPPVRRATHPARRSRAECRRYDPMLGPFMGISQTSVRNILPPENPQPPTKPQQGNGAPRASVEGKPPKATELEVPMSQPCLPEPADVKLPPQEPQVDNEIMASLNEEEKIPWSQPSLRNVTEKPTRREEQEEVPWSQPSLRNVPAPPDDMKALTREEQDALTAASLKDKPTRLAEEEVPWSRPSLRNVAAPPEDMKPLTREEQDALEASMMKKPTKEEERDNVRYPPKTSLRHVDIPDDMKVAKAPTKKGNDPGPKPRNLIQDLKPRLRPQQVPPADPPRDIPPVAAPQQAQDLKAHSTHSAPSKPSLGYNIADPPFGEGVTPSAVLHATVPHAKPRRYSAPTSDYDQPPPLFTLASNTNAPT